MRAYVKDKKISGEEICIRIEYCIVYKCDIPWRNIVTEQWNIVNLHFSDCITICIISVCRLKDLILDVQIWRFDLEDFFTIIVIGLEH